MAAPGTAPQISTVFTPTRRQQSRKRCAVGPGQRRRALYCVNGRYCSGRSSRSSGRRGRSPTVRRRTFCETTREDGKPAGYHRKKAIFVRIHAAGHGSCKLLDRNAAVAGMRFERQTRGAVDKPTISTGRASVVILFLCMQRNGVLLRQASRVPGSCPFGLARSTGAVKLRTERVDPKTGPPSPGNRLLPPNDRRR